MLHVAAHKISQDGYTFDSAREHRRYCELRLMQRARMIFKLEVHPRFSIDINGTHVGHYTADFRYQLNDGRVVVEDVKSRLSNTGEFSLRRRVVEALYGIKVEVVDPDKAKRRK